MEVLAELVAKISADASELKKGLSDAEKDIAGTGKALERETKSWQEQFKAVGKLAIGMGASITAAMTMAIMSFTKTGSELHDLSLKTGVSAKALAGLKYAAEQNGASLGTVEMAIRRTASAMQDAKDGLAETKRGFDRMGLSLTELEGLNPEEQFMKIAGAIANIPDPMTRAATAQDLFGRSGMDMLPMLSEGADGLKRMMEEGIKLTGWTEEGTKAADALGDAFGTLKTSTMGIFNAIGVSLAPTIKELADKITGLVSRFADWAKEHPELVKQVGLLALALGGFLTLAGTLMMLAPAIAAAWGVAMGPVGLITLAIAGLIAAGILLWQNWDKVTNAIGIGIKKIVEGLTWLMYRFAEFVNLFNNDWAVSIWKAANSMTAAVQDFGTKSVDSLNKTTEAAKGTEVAIAGVGNAAAKGVGQTKAAAEELIALADSYNRAQAASKGYLSAYMQMHASLTSALGYGGVTAGVLSSQRYSYGSQEEFEAALVAGGAQPTGTGFLMPGSAGYDYSAPGALPQYASGGTVSGAIGQPQLAMVHGGETIIPANESSSGVVVNFTQPVFFEREDQLNRFADIISRAIDRKYRLNGRSLA